MKTCTVCKTTKDDSDFHKNRTMKDGLCFDCKSCKKKRFKAWREKNIFRDRYMSRRWQQNNLEKERLKHRRYREAGKNDPLFKLKDRTRHKTRELIKRGIIQKKPCEVCGYKISNAHHEDYNDPYKVVFLCAVHHSQLHAELSASA